MSDEDAASKEFTEHLEKKAAERRPSDEPAADADKAGDPRSRNLDLIMQIPVSIEVVLGTATMPVAQLMKLGQGSIIALDHRVGEPIDVVVNGRVIARGEVVLMDDDSSRFGVSLTEIVGAMGASDSKS